MNPVTFTPEEVSIEVQGEETVSVMGMAVPTTRLALSFLGSEFWVWMAKDGVVKQEAPGGLVMVRESQEQALSRGDAPSPDLLTHFSVPCPMRIEHPEHTSRLVVRLQGSEGLELEDERQRLVSSNPITIEVIARPPLKDSLTSHVERDKWAEDLAATTFIQSNHPDVIAAAQKAIGERSTLWEDAQQLLWWVHRSLRKAPTLSVPSALEVLALRHGDCNEHAVLLCALARASGIPSRICVGLVYMDGAFYYHAWTKVFVGEWVAMDPALGQTVADAAHLKLAEGDWIQQFDLLKVLGKLEVQVVEYQ